MKKYNIGYTSGVFDLFHIGHLNIIKKSKEYCDFLIVGVTTDEETLRIKGKNPVIPFSERIEIIKSLRYVDQVVAENNTDKIVAYQIFKFDVIFKGDDWRFFFNNSKYNSFFVEKGVDVIFFERTKNISSSKIRINIKNSRK